MYQYGNTMTAVVWEGVIHEGVVLNELLYLDGDVFLDREYLPDGTVIVVKKGTRLHGVCGVEGELDLGWVKLIGAGTSCQDLPEYKGSDLEGTLWIKEYRNRILVVSEELWKERWEEMARFLLSRDMAWSDTWIFQCHEASEVEIILEGDPESGSIRVGSWNHYIVDVLKDKAKEFVFVLDDFLGRVLLPTSGKSARLGLYELKDYGWEYKTLPSSYYTDPEMVRIVFKLVKGIVLTLLREGKLSYRILDDGRAAREEYYRFLTQEETEYLLSFPEKWHGERSLPSCQ
jgi:hypothetical protein